MVIDTNILIAYLAGEGSVVEQLSEWKESGVPLYLPTVVEAELLSFSKWTSGERRATELFLEQHFISIPFDRSIARVAAQIRRTTHIALPDAIIAASAFLTHTALVTRDVTDFPKVPNLRLIIL